MSEVVKLTVVGGDGLLIEARAVLEGALNHEPDTVLVITEKDGELEVASTHNRGTALLLMEKARDRIVRGE